MNFIHLLIIASQLFAGAINMCGLYHQIQVERNYTQGLIRGLISFIFFFFASFFIMVWCEVSK